MPLSSPDKMNKPYILCVDDDKSILISLKAQLQFKLDGNFIIETAQSAEEAI
jgi:CheY-like chemotaxis protein